MNIKDQIEKMFKDIPTSTEKNSMMDEIMLNLTDKVNDLIEEGMAEEEAIIKTLDEFGDIDEIKDVLMEQEFTRRYRRSRSKKALEFSILGSVLIISSLLFFDFYYFPNIVFSIIPSIMVLWWPITMFYVWRRAKDVK